MLRCDRIRRSRRIALLALAAVILLAAGDRPAWPAEEFGRFFTTPRQRERLDELRKSVSGSLVKVKEEELKTDDSDKKVQQPRSEIRLKGVVYRTDGVNTAWINDSNSYEGDATSEYTKVNEHEIDPKGVKMVLPGDKKTVRLKVGESYDSSAGKTNDILPDDDIIKQ